MYGQLVMGLFYKRRTACVGWTDGQLVPTAVKLIEKMLKLVGKFKTIGCVAGKIYSVTNRDKNKMFTVNIVNQVCSCEQWQMRGFPCQHAVCALKTIRVDWPKCCSPYFRVESYRATYAPVVHPLDDPKDWVKVDMKLNTPISSRSAGRPRTKRIKSYDEPRV
ncbi:uncharacterized protein LOC113304971 [Papaver somniferum]|uniref:uncharacterized protein LOC113304971 n=1 Tax=Papaver somniferum TaxID=3469 RepID=UPI000E700DFD|nr:uncharacterized protein LOC113304971 [Papaver somniferum]